MARKITFLNTTVTTGSVTSTAFGVPFPHRWGVFTLAVATTDNAGTVVTKLQFYDPASAKWQDLKDGAQAHTVQTQTIGSATKSFITIDKVLTETATKGFRQIIPSTLRAVATVSTPSGAAVNVTQQGS